MSSLRQTRSQKRKCYKCYKFFSTFSIFSNMCDDCRKKLIVEQTNRQKAERLINNSECGFCKKPLLHHKEFDLKNCLYSLRGYIIRGRDV